MARVGRDEPEDEDGDDYDAEFDYDPDDPEMYPEGLYADDERAVIPCPHCRAEIDEESEQCPKCGMYLSREDATPPRRSAFVTVMLVVALLIALFWVRGC